MSVYGYFRQTVITDMDEKDTIMMESGCDTIYSDNCSYDSTITAQLDCVISLLSSTDTLLVDDLKSLARRTSDLVSIVNVIIQTGAQLESVNQPWINTVDPVKKTAVDVLGDLLEFERGVYGERIAIGMKLVALNGGALGRAPVDKVKLDHAIELYKQGKHSVSEIVTICGVSKSTLYRALRKQGLVRY